MRTIDKILARRDSRYGAPMGRSNTGTIEDAVGRIYDCRVALDSGGYSKDATYWGFPDNLRVSYDKGLNYIRFYRTSDAA